MRLALILIGNDTCVKGIMSFVIDERSSQSYWWEHFKGQQCVESIRHTKSIKGVQLYIVLFKVEARPAEYKAHETDQDLGLMTRHVVGAWCMVDRNGVLTDSMFYIVPKYLRCMFVWQ